MASDLIIIPDRSLTGFPTIQFSGCSGTSLITLQVLQDGSISIMGSQGQLFGVSDSLVGSLQSVTDIAGLPIFEVFSDDRVVASRYGANAFVMSGRSCGFGTASPSQAVSIHTTGTVRIDGGGIQLGASTATGGGIAVSNSAYIYAPGGNQIKLDSLIAGGIFTHSFDGNARWLTTKGGFKWTSAGGVETVAIGNSEAAPLQLLSNNVAGLTIQTNLNATFTSGVWMGITGDYTTASGALSVAQARAISGALATTIAASAAGVSTFNGLSGALNLSTAPAPANYVTFSTSGSTFLLSGLANPSFSTLLLGTQTANAPTNGLLQLATHATSGGGIGLGPTVSLYSSSTNNLTQAGGADPRFNVLSVGGITAIVQGSDAAGHAIFGSASNHTVAIRANSVAAVTFTPTTLLAAFTSGVQLGITGDYTTNRAASVAQLLAVSGILATSAGGVPAARVVIPVTGNFAITGGNTNAYNWTGIATYGGTLPQPSVYSGMQLIVKNLSRTSNLILSGTVDYDTNYTLIPRAGAILISDAASWNLI